ncbi:MarR family winged helix-turn-helix transcriptional regulator [Lysinibacillus endophyticus]|uniref:MarR family transcriptional regulator n=1 Tax=Ureibacillus endophyticus TaxID=1978490 RepID=A0A494YVD0_9BACL|nr:winged helix DNA-binding protein [Lysinibacillus endophyticus]MCP1146405.1 winged helix DNA-binding protein [Lysinibacillus endophyticus]RKQ13984.1 MarR family transcriptional regulator [Lysinibacillus endophyticus]
MEGFFQNYLRLYRSLITSLNELMSNYHLSYSLWQVMYYIKNYGPSTLVDISNYYNVEKPTITRRVHRLEELQIVVQIPGKDRREKIIQLTELGEQIYKECRLEIINLEKNVMEGISKEDQHITYLTLPKIQHNIMKREGNKIE